MNQNPVKPSTGKRPRSLGCALLMLWPIISFLTRSAPAETLSIVPDQCAYVRNDGVIFGGAELNVGFRNFIVGPREYRAALRFPLPESLRAKRIEKAILKLNYFDAWGSFDARNVSAFLVTSPWAADRLPFNLQRAAGVNDGRASANLGTRQFGWREWDVTFMAQTWKREPLKNHGLMLIPDEAGSMDNAFRFRSCAAPESSVWPVLVIQYSDGGQPPAVAEQPGSRTAETGESIRLRVEIRGAEPITARWYKDGQPISDARHSSARIRAPDGVWDELILQNARAADSGRYSVVLSNEWGEAASEPAALTIVPKRPSPSEVWRHAISTPNEQVRFDPPMVVQDQSGGILLAAGYRQESTGLILIKVNANGKQRWRYDYRDPLGRPLTLEAATADRSGNSYAAGKIENDRLYLLKISPDGQLLWASRGPGGLGADRIFVDESGNVNTWSAGALAQFARSSPAAGHDPNDTSQWNLGGVAQFDRNGFLRWPEPLRFGGNQPVVATARLESGGRLVMFGWGGGKLRRFALDLLTPEAGMKAAADWETTETRGPRNSRIAERPGGLYALEVSDGKLFLACFGTGTKPLWRSEIKLGGPAAGWIPALEVNEEGNAFVAAIHQLSPSSRLFDVTFQSFRPELQGEPSWQARLSEWELAPRGPLESAYEVGGKAELRLFPDIDGGLAAAVGIGNKAALTSGADQISHLLKISNTGRLLWRETPPWVNQHIVVSDREVPPVAFSGQGSFAAAYWRPVGAGLFADSRVIELIGKQGKAAPAIAPAIQWVSPVLREGGNTVPPGTQVAVELGASSPASAVEAMDFFLDDEWIGRSVGQPHGLTLPPLAEGPHQVVARASVGGSYAWSNPLQLYSGSDQALIVPAETLRRTLFAAYATDHLIRNESTPDGLVNSALIDVIASVRREFPDLPLSFYTTVIDKTKARLQHSTRRFGLASAGSAGRVVRTAYDPDQNELNDLFATIGDVIKTVPGGAAVVNSVNRLLLDSGKRCDAAGGDGYFCSSLSYFNYRNRNIEDIVAAFQNESGTLFRRLRSGLEGKIDASSREIIRTFKNEIELTRGELGGIRGEVTQALGAIEAMLDGQGALRGTVNDLRAEFRDAVANINDGIDAQREIAQQSVELQDSIHGLLLGREERERAEAEQRANSERAQAEKAIRMQGLQSSVYLLSALASFSDPKLAGQISAVGENSLKIYDALEKFNAAQNLGGWASAALAANYVSAGLAIAQAFSGPSGPSADEILFEQIGVLKEMIVSLGEQMHERFDRVDQALNMIYTEFSRNFAAIDFRLGVIEGQLERIHVALNEINAKLDAIQRTQYLLAQEAALRDLDQARQEMFRFDPESNPMNRETFSRLAAAFYSFAENTARSETFAPLRELNQDDRAIAESLRTAGGVHGALRYLAALAGRHRSPAGRFLAADRNPVAWEEGVSAYLDLAESWRDHAGALPSARNDLAAFKSKGESLRSALADLTLTASGGQVKANRALWQALIDNYRAKASAFVEALRAEEVLTRHEKLDPAGGDVARRLAADSFDFWGALDQPVIFEPAAFREKMKFGGRGMDGGELELPPGLLNFLADAGFRTLILADFLKEAAFQFRYGDAARIDRRERRSLREPAGDPRTNGGATTLWKLWDSRLELFLFVEGVFPNSPDGLGGRTLPLGEFWYQHPDHHWDSWQQFLSASAGAPDRLTRSGEYGGPPSGAPYAILGGVPYWPWDSIAQHVQAYWIGGDREPKVDLSPSDRLAHPEWDRRPIKSARELFLSRAMWRNGLNDAFDGPIAGAATGRRALEARLESKLREFQIAYYDRVRSNSAGPGHALESRSRELSGARALLESFARLAFPHSFESDDALRGVFLGNEPLPDGAEMERLCWLGINRSQNSVNHRDRIRFDEIMNRRLDAASAAIMGRLDEIERAGEPETLPLLANTLRRIETIIASLYETTPPPEGGGGGGEESAPMAPEILLRHDNGALARWRMAGASIREGIVWPQQLAPGWNIIGTGDFNHDAEPDYVLENERGQLGFWLMKGGSVAQAVTWMSVPKDWQVVAFGDFDGDNHCDMALQHSDSSLAFWMMTIMEIREGIVTFRVPGDWRIAAAGDLDGDRKSDLILVHPDRLLAFWLMDGARLKAGHLAMRLDPGWSLIGASDFDGDDHTDLLLGHENGGLGFWFMNRLSLSIAATPFSIPVGWRILTVR